MPERKSGRAKKAVDYSKFALGADDGSDDDFAESCTPPVAKKQKASKENKTKETKKENKQQLHKKEMREQQNLGRKSIDDKLYERDLQDALDLSLSQSDSVSQEDSVVVTQSDDMVPLATSTQNDDISVLESDSMNCDEISVIDANDKKRRTSEARCVGEEVVSIVSDDDSADDDDFTVGDEDDEGDSSDDDYSPSPVVPVADTRRRKLPATTVAKKVESKSASGKKASILKSTPQAKPTIRNAGPPVLSPAVRTKPSGLTSKPSAASVSVARSPAYGATTPSSHIGGSTVGRSPLGGVNIKSPSGGLRLGLSRNVRYLSTFGGADVREMVDRFLKETVSNEAPKLYSMKGLKGKRKFENLPLLNVL